MLQTPWLMQPRCVADQWTMTVFPLTKIAPYVQNLCKPTSDVPLNNVFYRLLTVAVVLLFCMFHTISAQNVDSLYRISFADKGNVDFSETSVLYQSTLSGFHPEARTRRALTNKKPLLDSLDQPVAQEYLDSLASRGITPLIIRNWTNSVVAELNEQERASLLSLRFVSSVQAVRKVAYQKFTDEFTDVFPCQPARPGESAASHNLINTTPLHDAGILGQGVRYGLIDCGFRWNNMT